MADLNPLQPPFQNKVTDPDGYMDRGWLSYFTEWAGKIIAGAVNQVSGTTGRIVVGGTQIAPTINIDPSYVASAAQGGTGHNAYTLGDILYASNSSALTRIPGAVDSFPRILTQTGTGSVSASPNWMTRSALLQVFNVLDYGAKGDGVTDDTSAIQRAINAAYAAGGGIVFYPVGGYNLTSKLVGRSGVWHEGQGWGSVLTGFQLGNSTNDPAGNHNYPFIDLDGCEDVKILSLKVDGQGSWTATPFANPYGGGNSVGFNNHDAAIRIKGACDNIEIRDCNFTGLSFGLYCYGDDVSTNVKFADNRADNLGRGNALQMLDGFQACRNIIDTVQGNMTAAGVTTTATSNTGDGIYIDRCINGTVNDNVISNVVRIGIVLEGDGVTLCRNITISGNSVRNAVGNRGTEINAFYWIEGNKAEQPIILSGNTGYNSDAIGILARDCVISGGSIRACATAGISGGNFKAVGVYLSENKYGADVSNSAVTEVTVFQACTFERNTLGGLSIEHGTGHYQIVGNMFRDNGTTALTGTPTTGFGVRINGYEASQHVYIQGNTFASGVNQADNHALVSGQFYGIMGVAGGASRNQDWIANNTFLYTGTVSAYASNVAAVPCAYAYDTGGGSPTLYDFMGYNGNMTSKFPAQINMEITHLAGIPRFLGFADNAPVSGAFLRGDWYFNKNQAATSGMIFLCTASGSPGTWEERLWGNTITSGGLDVTGTIHSRSGRIVLEGTNLFQAYGVGTDVSANAESLDLYHNGAGAGGAVIRANKTGTGTYRSISLQTGGADTLVLDASNNVSVSAGGLKILTAGKGISIKAGANGRINLGVVMVGGTATVSNASVTANTLVLPTRTVSGGTIGDVTVTKNAGVGYTLTSANILDTSTFDCLLVEAT